MNKKQGSDMALEAAIDMISGAATALMYTDDEINEVFEPDSAKEFIGLRNRVLKDLDLGGSCNEGYSFDAGCSVSMLAAEEGAGYAVPSKE